MKAGDKVRIVKLTTERGFVWDSLRPEFEARKVGRVYGDATGHLSWPVSVVDFGDLLKLEVPNELLQTVR